MTLSALALAVALGRAPTSSPASPSPLPNDLLAFQAASSTESLALTLDLTRGVALTDQSTDKACRLKFAGLTRDRLPLLDPILPDSLLPHLHWGQDGNDPVLEIPWTYRLPVHVRQEGLSPVRIMVTLDKLFTEVASQSVAPGLVHESWRRCTAAGPLSIHVLDVDLKVSGLRVAPVLAEGRDGHFGLEPVSKMTRRVGAAAAVNGTYFGWGGQPLGLLMIGGQLVSGPIFARTTLALSGAHPFIERTALSAYLELPLGESLEVDGVNQPRWADMVAVYTDRNGKRTRTPAATGSFEAAIDAQGRVVATGSADTEIPPGGFVVSTTGPSAPWLVGLLVPGATASLHVPLSDYWEGVTEAIAGGPRLLSAGQITVNSDQERFPSDIAVGRAPRTAIGLKADGTLLIVTVDGRSPSHSIGLTLPETAQLLKELGATEAMNLDGGGSTTLVLDQKVQNRPSDGSERPVSNALCVWTAPPAP